MSARYWVLFIARGFGRFIRLALACITIGLTAVTSVSIYSTEKTKSSEFYARQAEADARRQELELALRRQDLERARVEYEKQNRRNIGGGNDKPKKKAGNRK